MSEPLNRRDFGRWFGLGALSTGLGSVPATADEPPAKEPVPAPKPTDIPPHEHLLEVVVREYPHENLTDEIREKIAGDLRSQLSRGRQLREFALENGEAPLVFQAYRGPDVVAE